jgi:hypothetical protein
VQVCESCEEEQEKPENGRYRSDEVDRSDLKVSNLGSNVRQACVRVKELFSDIVECELTDFAPLLLVR